MPIALPRLLSKLQSIITIDTANNNLIVANSIVFSDGTKQTTAGVAVDAYARTTANGANGLASGAYAQANTATGIAQAAFNSANNVAPQVQPAFDKANSANVLAQAAYDSSNAVNQYATSAYGVANTNATNITLVNQYAVSGYNQANTATGIAQAAFNSANNVAPQVQPAFDKANAANSLAQSAYDSSNAVNQYSASAYGTANTNATNITLVNQYAASGYALANTNATNITLVNQFTQSAYNAANAAGSSAYVQSAFDKANSANSLAQSAYNAANTALSGNTIQYLTVSKQTYTATAGQTSFAVTYTPGLVTLVINGSTTDSSEYTATNGSAIVLNNAASLNDIVDITGFVSANTISSAFTGPQGNTGPAGPEFTGNTAYRLITTNTQNAISTSTGALIVYGGAGISGNVYSNKIYTDGIFYSANGLPFQMGSPDLTDNWARQQANTNNLAIVAVNQYAAAAYNQANVTIGVDATQNSAISIIQSVDLTQNTNITAVNNFAQSAYNTANTKFNSSGGNITGSVTISGNNDLTVTGNLYLTGTQFVSNTQSFVTQDPLLVLGLGNYTSDAVDIGFASHYNDGSNAHTGLIRDYGTKEYYFFKGYTPELDTNNNININDVSFSTANVNAGYFRGNVISRGYDILDFAQAAYNSANNVAPQVQPAFDKANTASANTIIIQGVDLTQNTNITTANNAAWAAYAAGNTNATDITLVNQFAQSAYNAANAAGSSSYVQAAFDKANTALANTTGTFAGSLTTTGNVRVTSTQAATSTTTGALTVSGGVGVTGNIYAGNIYTNGALISNSAALTVYKYVATAGQTTFSGTDVNSLTLSYVASAIFVTLNGVVLNNTLEYTATNGTSVVLGTAAELDDELNIYSFGAFQIADTYTITQADSKFLTQANAITDYVSTANGTAINQFAAGAYTTANTAQTTATGANGLAAGAFDTANGANGLASGAFNKANNAVAQTGGSITGSLSVSQNLIVSGNLTILGNSTSIGVSTLEVSDPLIVLGIGNYTTDIVDIGFAGHYNDGANAHTGLMRDFGTKEYYFFKDYTPELGSNNNINIAHPSFATTNVYASFFKGNVISQGYELFSYSSAAFAKANTAYTNAVNGSNTSVQFSSVGVGTAASGTYGEIRAINNITGYYSSDKKYKENVINIPDALNKVDAIGGKMFDWTDSYIQEHGGEDGYFVQKRDFGVIAQDVQAVFPEAVRTREDGSLAVDYSKLSALAFAAIIELKKEIEQLKNNK